MSITKQIGFDGSWGTVVRSALANNNIAYDEEVASIFDNASHED